MVRSTMGLSDTNASFQAIMIKTTFWNKFALVKSQAFSLLFSFLLHVCVHHGDIEAVCVFNKGFKEVSTEFKTSHYTKGK